MSDALELKKLVKQLQSASSDSETIELLALLKNDFKVNEAILRESKAGLAVGKLRTHTSKGVSDAAKELVKKWKTEVEKAKQGSSAASAKPAAPSRKSSIATPVTPTISSVARTAKSDGVTIPLTDPVRKKCAELIYDGLAMDAAAGSLLLQRATTVENSVYESQGGTTAEYKSKIRSLYVNLKDKNNPSLREGVISGEIPADKLHTLSAEDMASDKRKSEIEKLKAQNFHNSLGAQEPEAETDAFQCSRCKQRKTRYRQAQTRSADEPMTTFVTCTNCNHRWKFS